MNLNHLAVFHAVAEEGGVSRGAARLCVSQPAVSKQVRELEASLGLQLFDRLPRGVRLTEAGEILAGHARRLFAAEADAERAVAELKGLSRGSLRVGASLTIGVYLLPEILGAYRQRHPHIALELEIANTRVIQRILRENALDAALTEGVIGDAGGEAAGAHGADDLEAEVFRHDDLVAVVPPGHPLLSEKSVSAARFCAEPFLMREAGSGTRAVVERALALRGLAVRPAMSLGSTEAIKRAVASGLGVSILSRLALSAEAEAGRLRVLEIADLEITRPLHIVRLRGRSETRAARAFFALLREEKEEARRV